MENISVFQVGNYIQYPCQSINNGETAMIVDRISSIDDVQVITEKGLTIQKSLALSQFYPLPIEPEWLEALGFEKFCNESIFSVWEQSFGSPYNGKPINIIILEHNENRLFFLGILNTPLFTHTLQNLCYNITGNKLNLPITL